MKLSIIGGTGPQGKGLALRFAKVGFEVALGSRDAARASEVANSLSSSNPNLAGQIVGLSNSQAIAFADKFVIFSFPLMTEHLLLSANFYESFGHPLYDHLNGQLPLHRPVTHYIFPKRENYHKL